MISPDNIWGCTGFDGELFVLWLRIEFRALAKRAETNKQQ